MLCALPEVERRYLQPANYIFECAPSDPTSDFNTQMCKVVCGTLSGRYSYPLRQNEDADQLPTGPEVAPRLFKHLVGKGHAEFSTGRQQDAGEYLQHLLELMRRADHSSRGRDGVPSVPSLFQFEFEDRLECAQSKAVRYIKGQKENILTLQIPVEGATNIAEVQAYKAMVEDQIRSAAELAEEGEGLEEVRPLVPLSVCLEKMASPSVLLDWNSPLTGQRGTATKVGNVDGIFFSCCLMLLLLLLPCIPHPFFRQCALKISPNICGFN
jgi:ubiquitin carboxyl-terminal hydrolase 5/13